MSSRRISFALLLPIVELTLWSVLVPSQAATLYWHLRASTHLGSELRMFFGDFGMTIPRAGLWPFAFETVAMHESHLIAAINLPGVFVELPLSAVLSWPNNWRPTGWPLFYWRAVSLPFFCLPAWWFLGRAVDGLLGYRRLRWWTLLFGTILCAGFAVILCGFLFGLAGGERRDMEWVLCGFGFWTAAFAAFPVLWTRQGRNRKAQQLSAGEHAAV